MTPRQWGFVVALAAVVAVAVIAVWASTREADNRARLSADCEHARSVLDDLEQDLSGLNDPTVDLRLDRSRAEVERLCDF